MVEMAISGQGVPASGMGDEYQAKLDSVFNVLQPTDNAASARALIEQVLAVVWPGLMWCQIQGLDSWRSFTDRLEHIAFSFTNYSEYEDTNVHLSFLIG